ncbi:MAG: hypothetical protein HY721_07070 [Planctomycetes bacterium]|nr:hypothetical protein [Planctomycetota bacterium]
MRHGHADADERNLALHRLALEKLRAAPEEGVLKVLALLDRWLAMPHLKRQAPLLREWREVLRLPVQEIEARVLSEAGQELRQCSPLGVLIDPRERFAVYRRLSRR